MFVSSLRRRLILATLTAVGVAAGVMVAFLSLREPATAPGSSGRATYRDPAGAWEISYPDRFRRGTIPRPFHPRVITDGIWIANWNSPTFSQRTGGPILSDFPNDGVVVFVSQTFGGPVRVPLEPDSTLPVTFEDLEVVSGPTPGVWRMGSVLANGDSYLIRVRVLPDANQEDRQAVADIVFSFRILPVEEGTVIGSHPTFYVLGPPEFYPVGSVTRFDASGLPGSDTGDPFPFYLLRVPAGFYALAWPGNLVGGYKDCDVRYSFLAQEFICSNGARWALDGSVIDKPDPEMRDDPLKVLLVRISLDDHVLVSPNVGMSDTETDLELT